MTEIVSVNRSQAVVLTDDGETWPVTQWIDDDGDDCEAEDAVIAVAEGPDSWAVIDLRDFENVAVN